MSVSQAIAPRKASDRPFVLRKGISTLSDLKDGGAGYPGDYPGRVYYVNNITGDSSYDGLSWETPFAEVSEAVTASETFRALPSGTTNDYVRNIIYVQGTGTAYTALTALPLYCDIIGIGAEVRGTNQGVPRIGADTGAANGCVITDTVRGLNIYNIQFQAGAAKTCFGCTNMFRSGFYNCSFMTNGAATGNPAYGFRAIGAIGSIVMKDCFFGSSASIDTEPDIGISLEGTHVHNCHFEGNFICGLTAGVVVAYACIWNWGTIFKSNFIGSASQQMAIGIDDNTGTNKAHIMYCGNYIHATAAGTLVSDGTARWIANYEDNGFSTVTAS